MLDDIPAESLFSLLTTVRTAVPPPPAVPTIVSQYSDDGLQGDISVPHVDFMSQSHWGDVLELQGPSGSGKSQILYILLAVCIAPSSLGGWQKAAVLFDTEGTFESRNFHRVLLSRLVRAAARLHTWSDEAQLQLLADTALHKLHVFRPVSTAQLAASVHNLPAYQKAHMPDADIGLVAIDSMSTFYWSDRFSAEQLRPLNLANTTPLQHVIAALQNFRLSHNPITVLTNWALTVDNSNGTTAPPLYKQHLPSFPSLTSTATPFPLTHHITLDLTSVPPLHNDPSLTLPTADNTSKVTGYIRRPGNSQPAKLMVDIVHTLSHDALHRES
ncbi:hypothetical protein R3P38DRAFT_2822645 [Favolaschia claudopus]|uniref:RecA family profile 1 domain-containing protein n=1 Tax=Favolaschia claudopus TaxID=2862362 RepID=A0AAW0EGR5_9AGAR